MPDSRTLALAMGIAPLPLLSALGVRRTVYSAAATRALLESASRQSFEDAPFAALDPSVHRIKSKADAASLLSRYLYGAGRSDGFPGGEAPEGVPIRIERRGISMGTNWLIVPHGQTSLVGNFPRERCRAHDPALIHDWLVYQLEQAAQLLEAGGGELSEDDFAAELFNCDVLDFPQFKEQQAELAAGLPATEDTLKPSLGSLSAETPEERLLERHPGLSGLLLDGGDA